MVFLRQMSAGGRAETRRSQRRVRLSKIKAAAAVNWQRGENRLSAALCLIYFAHGLNSQMFNRLIIGAVIKR
ncbi:hypothetical protein CBW22_05010 [Pantoea sp. VS1]|nr:hypothetical protein CBW22_05010 [Pantoea sp. VS1]